MAEPKVGADLYFSIVPEFVVDCGNARAIQVYAIIARYTNAEGVAWPGRGTLAERAGCGKDTVDRAVTVLVEMGAITVERTKKEDGSYETNHYTLIYAKVQGGSRTHTTTPSRTTAEGVAAPTRTQLETDNESHVELLASAPQNAWWDALESVFGYRPIGAEAALWGRMVKHIQEAGDSPEEIPRRAALWLVGPVWEGRERIPRLTPGAFLKHWQWLGSKVASASEAELASWRDEYKKLEVAKNIEGAT